jgi:hypothetical protein
MSASAVRVLLSWPLLLSMSACIASPPEIMPVDTTSPKTIAVVSALGDRVDFDTKGIVAFGDETSTGNIASWDLDDQAYKTVKSVLSSDRSVIRIDVTADSVEPLANAFSTKEIAASLKAALPGSAPAVDEIILIRRLAVNNQLGEPAPSMGVVLGQDNPIGFGRQIGYSVAGQIDVIDGRTLLPLAQKQLLSDHCPVGALGIGPSECLGGKELDNSYAVSRWSSLTPAQMESLRQMVAQTLDYEIRYSLGKIHLN